MQCDEVIANTRVSFEKLKAYPMETGLKCIISQRPRNETLGNRTLLQREYPIFQYLVLLHNGGKKKLIFFKKKFLIQILKQIQSCLGASQTFYCDKVQNFQCDCARTCTRDEILYILHLGFVAVKYDNEIQKHTEQNEKAQPKQSRFTLLN